MASACRKGCPGTSHFTLSAHLKPIDVLATRQGRMLHHNTTGHEQRKNLHLPSQECENDIESNPHRVDPDMQTHTLTPETRKLKPKTFYCGALTRTLHRATHRYKSPASSKQVRRPSTRPGIQIHTSEVINVFPQPFSSPNQYALAPAAPMPIRNF